MSIDNSLRIKSGALRSRSVLTRLERLEKLEKARKWKAGDNVMGLPKVRVVFKQKGKKKEPKKAAAAAPAAGAAAAPAAAAKKK
ncbi:MAG: small basic protein [Planctomycetes bacterium]|nr:small basic protein [Planctomycetota bacterium]